MHSLKHTGWMPAGLTFVLLLDICFGDSRTLCQLVFEYNEVAELRWVAAFLDDMLTSAIHNCRFPACLWGSIQNRICFYIKAGVVHKWF